MKKIILALFLVLSAMAGFAQSRALASNEGYVILQSLGLYAEKGTTLEWKETLDLGDKVAILGRVSKFKVDGTEREYIRIKAPSGNEGWARTAYVIQKAVLAVVKTDGAVVYSEPREVKITSGTISHMTMVAVLQDTTGSFAKILCFDQVQNKYYIEPAVFLSRDDLSFSDADVGAVILYSVASSKKDKATRANLFKTIQKNYSSSMFFEKISVLLNPPVAVSSGGKATAASSGFFTVTEDNVNVRAQPDDKAGEVLGRLNKGVKVEVIEVTAQTYTIGSNTAVWYRIKDPAGWIFGGFLDPAQ